MKILTLLFFLISIQLFGQANDSIDYVILKLLTKENCWLFRDRFDVLDRVSQEQIEYLKTTYQIEENRLKKNLNYIDKKWDRHLVGDRKLKGKNIFHLPRRKPLTYLSSVLYINKENTLAIVYLATWTDSGFGNSSGSGEVLLLEYGNENWSVKDYLGGFITRRPVHNKVLVPSLPK